MSGALSDFERGRLAGLKEAASLCEEYNGSWYVHRKGAAECARAIDMRIQFFVAPSGWISSLERMPEEWQKVLVSMKGKFGIGAWYKHASGAKGYEFNNTSIVGDDLAFQFWQPIPASPTAIVRQHKCNACNGTGAIEGEYEFAWTDSRCIACDGTGAEQ